VRILLLPSAYAPAVGGVEQLTSQLASHLAARGHGVEVWTHRHPPELAEVEQIDGLTVRRFAMSLPAAQLASLLRFGRDAVTVLPRMIGAARAFCPDVLHVQCFSANGVYATLLSRLMCLPLIVSLQGETVMDDHDIYEHSATLRAGLRAGLRQATTVTGCSQFVLDDAVERFGLEPGRGVVVRNGVELDIEAVAEPLALPFARFVFAVGRAVEKKGFDLLIDAYARIAARHPDVGLVIGGSGAALDGLRQLVRKRGLAERVVLAGGLSRGQVGWAMRNAAVFVMPSRIEPFGIVALEALAAGCPAIVTSRGGAAEIVRNDECGLVVDPFDSAALSAAIDRLLSQPELNERLAKAGRERVRRYSWEVVTESYLALYG
jgi:glycogen(starch) synthase